MSDTEEEQIQKKEKPKRVSRFAKRMAKKRSNLDRKLSKMKSKLRDVEDRKEAFAAKSVKEDDAVLNVDSGEEKKISDVGRVNTGNSGKSKSEQKSVTAKEKTTSEPAKQKQKSKGEKKKQSQELIKVIQCFQKLLLGKLNMRLMHLSVLNSCNLYH